MKNWKVIGNRHLNLIKHIMHQVTVLELPIADNFKASLYRLVLLTKWFVICFFKQRQFIWPNISFDA